MPLDTDCQQLWKDWQMLLNHPPQGHSKVWMKFQALPIIMMAVWIWMWLKLIVMSLVSPMNVINRLFVVGFYIWEWFYGGWERGKFEGKILGNFYNFFRMVLTKWILCVRKLLKSFGIMCWRISICRICRSFVIKQSL